jgi:putative endopeptidase
MKTKLYFWFIAAGIATTAFSCGGSDTENNGDAQNNAIDTNNFDKSVRMQDDFFQYINGSWLKNNPIPETEVGWGNFSVLAEKSRNSLREICEEKAKAQNTAGTNEQKIGDFYASGMDSATIDKVRFEPVQSELDLITGMKDASNLSTVLGHLHAMQASPGFYTYVTTDLKDSKTNALYLVQAGQQLPEKGYYKDSDPQSIALRVKYQEHMVRMFKLMGDDEATAKKNADMTYRMESLFADSSLSAVEQRDEEKQYNKMTTEEVGKLCPNLDWNLYFKELGLSDVKTMIVKQPAFMRQFNKLLKSESIDAWKAYFRWSFIAFCAPKLHSEVVTEHFSFFGQELSGARAQQPRWKRVLATTEGALGEALGKVYVEKNFSQEAKDRVNIMVDNLMAAYKERIQTRTWMSDSTKKAADAKLAMIIRKLGFPEKWRDYSGLTINRDSYVKNFLASNRFDAAFNLGKLSKPVDRMEWGMTPATVNAYYNPSYNEIVFPAAIMQTPFFDATADDAVNYGAMGAVIGHELTHGFDDQGSVYDGEGNMKNWWTEKDHASFNELTGKLVKQFNNFVAIDSTDLHVNGELTLGENIADLGGLMISLRAYQRSLKDKPEPAKIAGFTGVQRFFISWAQGWRNAQRPKALMQMVKTNPHAPARFRVLGPLSNISEFYEAFGVKEGDKMYRKLEDRLEIW